MTLMQAMTRAQADSELEGGVTQHVQAVIGRVPEDWQVNPKLTGIIGFSVSDWCDNSTVASFYNGRRIF